MSGQVTVYVLNVNKKIPGLDLKMNKTNIRISLFMFKRIADRKISLKKKTVTGILNQCEQKHAASLVFITKICEFCILLITVHLTNTISADY